VQKRRVLVLCTGNSCRSQMAEAIVNHDLGDTWEAVSAGTIPSGNVHPLALRALGEIGLSSTGLHSKSTEMFRGQSFDVVITVCDDAAKNCPVWLGGSQVVHIGFPDPAKAEGREEEQMRLFRAVRDGIRERIVGYLKTLDGTSPH